MLSNCISEKNIAGEKQLSSKATQLRTKISSGFSNLRSKADSKTGEGCCSKDNSPSCDSNNNNTINNKLGGRSKSRLKKLRNDNMKYFQYRLRKTSSEDTFCVMSAVDVDDSALWV